MELVRTGHLHERVSLCGLCGCVPYHALDAVAGALPAYGPGAESGCLPCYLHRLRRSAGLYGRQPESCAGASYGHGIYTRERRRRSSAQSGWCHRSRAGGSGFSICFQRRSTGGRSGSAACSIMPAGRRSRWGAMLKSASLSQTASSMSGSAISRSNRRMAGWTLAQWCVWLLSRTSKTMIYASLNWPPGTQRPAPHHGWCGR